MNTGKIITILLIGLYSLSASGQEFKSRHFKIEKLSPFVYAAIASPGGYAICNAGIIDLGDEVLVFDPFFTPQAAADLKKFINTVIKKPVRYVVNSHAHNDHYRGNQVFNGATIIATTLIRQDIEKTEPLEIADENTYGPRRVKYYDSIPVAKNPWQAEENLIWKGYFKGMMESHPLLKTTLPNMVFDDSMTIFGKNTTVRLISYGDAHTQSDLFCYLPGEKIAFPGDILFIQNHPWIGESKIPGWISYLQKIGKLDINILIPGHGPRGNKSSLTDMTTYLSDLLPVAKKLKGAANLTNDMINEQIPLQFASWHLKNFYAFNVRYLIEKSGNAQ
jgi:Zn-dependent hydrolases, including glyoxylases